MNPGLGRNFEAMDPLEWLARMVDHIPDPGKHRTLRYVARSVMESWPAKRLIDSWLGRRARHNVPP